MLTIMKLRYPKLATALTVAAGVLIVLEVVWGGDRGCDHSMI